MDGKAQLTAKAFKALVGAVTKYPNVGAFGGSEIISLRMGKGLAWASTMGVVLSKARVQAEGELELIGVDQRIIQPFASVCPGTGTVTLGIEENQLVARCGSREIMAALCPGQEHKLPAMKDVGGVEQFNVTKELAAKVGYLAEVAFSDSSRPELCAVMLAGDGRAMAVSQKTVAVFQLQNNGVGKVALPLPLAKGLDEKCEVWVSEKETLVRVGETGGVVVAWYVMPSPTKAQNEFPVAAVDQFGATGRDPVVTCKGKQLVGAVEECDACLGQVSRTGMVLKLEAGKGKIQLSSQNGTAKFRAVIKGYDIQREDAELLLPMEELVHVIPFLQQEEQVTLSTGKNGGMFISFREGWCMFAEFRGKGR
jgi:hypothetical protein